MNNGLSGFYHRSGRAFFAEPDSVGNVSCKKLLERMPKQYYSDVVAFDFPNWTETSFHWDYPGTIPDWADRGACMRLLRQVQPIWEQYKEVYSQAWSEYMKACKRARTEYKKACNRAQAEYERMHTQTRAEHVYNWVYVEYLEYEKACNRVYDEYTRVCDQAYAEYLEVCDQTQAEMINELSNIKGYLRERRNNKCATD